jgi:hypothetical protein
MPASVTSYRGTDSAVEEGRLTDLGK